MKNCTLAAALLAVCLFSSCMLAMPARKSNQSTNVEINNATAQIEPLKRDEYEVMKKTSGVSNTSRFYILFFPIGKGKSDDQLYENAYDDALDNLPGSDALLFPHRSSHKFFVPLLLVNYYHKKVTVSGVGISVKGKKTP